MLTWSVPSLRPWARWGSALLSVRSPLKPIYLGVFSGLLPCPVVCAFLACAFLAWAATTSSFLGGILIMVALGLGTVPVLLTVAVSGNSISPLLRSRLATASGIIMIILAGWTVYRGWAHAACCT